MTPRSRPAAPGASDAARLDPSAAGGRMGIVMAVVLAGVAALAQSVAALVGVVTGAEPAFLAWPLLVLFAALPAGFAFLLVVRGMSGNAAGVLAGAGLIAACGVVADMQVAIDATRMARPELLLPQIEVSPAWWSLGLLLAGKLLAAVAGVAALRSARLLPDDTSDRERVRQPLALLAAAFGLLVGLGALLSPYTSTDPLLLDSAALDGPPFVLAGAVLLAIAVPVVAALGVANRAGGVVTGILGGLALGGLPLAVLPLVAAWRLAFVHPTVGPVLVLVGVGGLASLATMPNRWLVGLLARRADGVGGDGDAHVPPPRVLYAIAGGLAIVASASAIAGAMTSLVIGPDGREVGSPAQFLLYPVGLGLGLLGVAAFLPAVTAWVRPIFSVAWTGALLVGTQVLSVPIAADELPIETTPGAAGWWTFGTVVMTVLLAVCSLVAGVVEREETGRSPAVADAEVSGGIGGMLIGGGSVLAGALVFGAFLLPVVRSPDYVPSALTGEIDVAFWGVLLVTLAVLGALGLVPRSGQASAVGLLTAVTGVVGLRLLESYAVGRRYDVTIGLGAWFAIGAIVVLVALAITVAIRGSSTER
ncbi:hypothetical protein [Haloechinothrix salitolerans]|uniref:Uncharacterized protein n=1 Tax=Haloechinothrix salitolerans TaxID=926830 RepID=A0ABW2C9Q3_9PSEU